MSAVAWRWAGAFAAAWRADLQERRRDWRAWMVVGLGLLLATVAAWLTATEVLGTLEARSVAQDAERVRWLNQGRKYPHSAAHYGVYVFKPLSPLAAVDPGVEPYVGSSVWLEAHKQNEFVYRPANDQAGMARQFSLTPAFVLQVLAPLAIVFLGFGAFAGERECGMLRALRLSGAAFSAVAAARASVLWTYGVALASPACLAVVAVQWSLAAANPFADAAWRSVVFAAGYGVYLLIWSLAVVAVSGLSGSLLRSLGSLLALWAAMSLLLPRAAVEWSRTADPLPSAQVFRQAMERDLGEPHDPGDEAREQRELLAQYGVRELKDLPVNWAGISLQRGEEHGDRVFDAHYARLFAAMAAQEAAAARIGWLTPAVAVANLSAAAAGSDTAHHVQFVLGAEAHRRLIQKLMNDKITASPERNGQRVEGDQDFWSQVPPLQFRFDRLAVSPALYRSVASLLGLLFAAALLLGLSVRRLSRGALA